MAVSGQSFFVICQPSEGWQPSEGSFNLQK